MNDQPSDKLPSDKSPSDKSGGDKSAPEQSTQDKPDAAAVRQRHQDALKHALEKKRQMQHQAHQHHAAKPKFAPKFSPSPIRRGPRGG